MKHLILFPMDDGGSILFEVESDEGESGLEPAARPGEVAARASETLENAINTVKPAAEAILSRLSNLSQRPEEIEVEFGLKASAQAGMFIASGTIEANYVVKLKWRLQDDKP
jgi:hypothetical protein